MYCYIALVLIAGILIEPAVTHDNFNGADSTGVAEAGKKEFELLMKKVELPEFGECWKDAVANLHEGCSHLSEVIQSKLALAFMDCFLAMSGGKAFKCHANEESTKREACIKQLPDRAFNVYLEFYTHSQSICFFLKSSIWQEMAENTIARLTYTSKDVSNQLDEVKESNKALLKTQQESLDLQQDLVENGITLGQILQESRMSVAKLMNELRESTAQQAGALGELSKRLTELQAWAIGEVSWIEAIVYYVLCVCITYMLTCFPRSQEARFWILLTLTGGLGIELVVKYMLIKGMFTTSYVLLYVKENLYFWVWNLRKILILKCVVSYAYCIYNYKDYTRKNYELLNKIHDSLSKLVEKAEPSQENETLATASFYLPLEPNKEESNNDSMQISLLNRDVEQLAENLNVAEQNASVLQIGMPCQPKSTRSNEKKFTVSTFMHTPLRKRTPKEHQPEVFTFEKKDIHVKISSSSYNLRSRSSTPRSPK